MRFLWTLLILISLNKTIEFPGVLSSIPHFNITQSTLESYNKKIPIKEGAYLLMLNKYGEIMEGVAWEVNTESIEAIVTFMTLNYSKRVYPTLSN